MGETADRKFDWIAGLATASGVAVIVPSLVVLAVSLIALVVVLV